MHKLVIIGAGGHGKVVADIAVRCGYRSISFLDDNAIGECLGFPIIGTCTDIANDGSTDFVLAVGNNATRKRLAEQYDLPHVTLIHPSAQIGFGVTIGAGTVVMANVVINPEATIGRHCIINTACVIEHNVVIDDFVHISPNASIAGTVQIGPMSWVGIGAAVKNNISICENCTIGAGAVVVKNIDNNGVYMGMPAKPGGVKHSPLTIHTMFRRCVA